MVRRRLPWRNAPFGGRAQLLAGCGLAKIALLAQLPRVHVRFAVPEAEDRHLFPAAAGALEQGAPVLLYDGDCGVCARSVQFVLARETARTGHALRFAPLQGDFSARLAVRFPAIVTANSVVWFDPSEPGAPLLRSDAALSALTYLGGIWRLLAVLGRAVPRPVRDAVYNAVATRRLTLAAPACLLPSPEVRQRFLR